MDPQKIRQNCSVEININVEYLQMKILFSILFSSHDYPSLRKKVQSRADPLLVSVGKT